MKKEDLITLAEEYRFSKAAVIKQKEIEFVPEFRKFCEANECGNFGANYACPPYSGTVEEMDARTMKFEDALVLMTEYKVKNALDPEETKPLKAEHNKRTRELAKAIGEKYGKPEKLIMTAGPCNLCKPCKMISGSPCLFPDERTSCLSAYSVNVEKLAEAAGLGLSWGSDKASFISIYLFNS